MGAFWVDYKPSQCYQHISNAITNSERWVSMETQQTLLNAFLVFPVLYRCL
jgi:hypothetical protein